MKLSFSLLLLPLIVLSAWVVLFVKEVEKNNQTSPICPKITCYEVKGCPLFEEALAKIGGRTYDLENYDCLDFSRDLVEELETAGIKSSIAIDYDREHAWVVVWIEATSGGFTLPDENLEIAELRDKNLNVICE